MSSIRDPTVWEPLLRVVRASHAERLVAPGGYLTGRIGLNGWSVPVRRPRPVPERAVQVEDMQEVRGEQRPLPILDLADGLLALWDRPLISRTVLEARLDTDR
ncbi:hypothetical protein [Streptomyces sp. NPDC000931]|uniref:hypothetical protein n=1 Tax=Streptomyces sp. NPDC000931 TaxID=3154372 RepID=UPI003327282E